MKSLASEKSISMHVCVCVCLCIALSWEQGEKASRTRACFPFKEHLCYYKTTYKNNQIHSSVPQASCYRQQCAASTCRSRAKMTGSHLTLLLSFLLNKGVDSGKVANNMKKKRYELFQKVWQCPMCTLKLLRYEIGLKYSCCKTKWTSLPYI